MLEVFRRNRPSAGCRLQEPVLVQGRHARLDQEGVSNSWRQMIMFSLLRAGACCPRFF